MTAPDQSLETELKTRLYPHVRAVSAIFVMALGATAAAAQDVELLGEHFGTRVPNAYHEVMNRDPNAFRFLRGFRSEGVIAPGSVLPSADLRIANIFGESGQPILGTFRFPLILGLYADSPPVAPFPRDQVDQEFFTGPNSRNITITDFYSELSGARVDLLGETHGWARSSLTEDDVAGTSNGLDPSDGVGEFIIETLTLLDDGSIDWGRYDNDGPDGIPNSGDDDGFVDVLGVMHATPGGECAGDDPHVWSHRWVLTASAGRMFVTSTISANGDSILINDFTIQPVMNCSGAEINEIGTFAHELGHGFGLPDLYAVGGNHAGIGRWGLMGSGNSGCMTPPQGQPSHADFPCHMSAWSKMFLGWIDVVDVPSGAGTFTLTLDPVESGGSIYKVDVGDGSGDFYLLENRQRIGTDVFLPTTGLFVWRVDPEQIENRRPFNRVNTTAARMGVWLRQADGLNELQEPGGGRGDTGDPFPGASGNTAFHDATIPDSRSHLDSTTGVTITDIQAVGQQMQFQLISGFQDVTLTALGAAGTDPLFTVDGVRATTRDHTFTSAPFETHEVGADAGGLGVNGLRNGFAEWTDGVPDRTRTVQTPMSDVTFSVTYGIPEVLLDVTFSSSAVGVVPAILLTDSPAGDGWVRPGVETSVFAEAKTGFSFTQWTGALAGQPNPLLLTVIAPTTAGAAFDVTFAISGAPTEVELEAATTQDVQFLVVEANAPVAWSVALGVLPAGTFLSPLTDSVGAILGVPVEDGTFEVTIRATDAIGIQADAMLNVRVTPPTVGLLTMASPFLQAGAIDLSLGVYLDRRGNADGRYDLGDFRAYVLSNPNAPVSAPALEARAPIVIRMVPRRDEEIR